MGAANNAWSSSSGTINRLKPKHRGLLESQGSLREMRTRESPEDSHERPAGDGQGDQASAGSQKRRVILELAVNDNVTAFGVMEASGARNHVITVFDARGNKLSTEMNGLLRKVLPV